MRSTTQRSRVADRLLQDIRDGRYAVSEKLPSERQLAEAFGVSRPVVREALMMLSSLDVVDIQVGRGAFVVANDVGPQPGEKKRSLIDVTDVREALETGALRMSATRARRQEKAAVRAALDSLSSQVARGEETAADDLALHRSIVAAARSPILLQLWTNLTDEIAQTIRLSPHGRAMSEEILEQHRVLANGILVGELDAALVVCAELHEDNRRFLRGLLR